MSELRNTQKKACMFPCFWVWVLYIIILLITIHAFWGLILCIFPLGYFLDAHQWMLRLFLRKWNKKLSNAITGNASVLIKFQTIKKELHEKKYLCIAHTVKEVEKLRKEPIFQRGTSMENQEYGRTACCPIDWHRVL